jgi:hypothetical protein
VPYAASMSHGKDVLDFRSRQIETVRTYTRSVT